MLYNVEPKIKEAYISKANSMVLGGWRERAKTEAASF